MLVQRSKRLTNERNAAITAARQLLESDVAAERDEICGAIGVIGKPYDADVIQAHASLVAAYLDHADHVVRHQALWLLGSWGHLQRYAAHIHDAAHGDPDLYNRAFAAKSLGSILKQEKDPALTKHILAFVEDEKEKSEVRLSAYSGLLYAWNRPDDFAFLTGEKTISEVDPEFMTQLHAWIEGKAGMPPATPPRGLLRSLIRACRADLI
jgi:HEAT repeat protein